MELPVINIINMCCNFSFIISSIFFGKRARKKSCFSRIIQEISNAFNVEKRKHFLVVQQ